MEIQIIHSLSIMEKITKCQLCGCNDQEVIYVAHDHYSQKSFYLVCCVNCSLVFTNPRPSSDELGEYYPPTYYGDAGQRFHPLIERAVHFFRKRLAEKIDSHFPSRGRVLEIGSGRGSLLSELAEKGWTAIGTEYSENIIKEVTDTPGVKVYPTPKLQDCKFPDQYFNVVICYHVLEHLPEPIRTLREIHRIIDPQGLLIIAVPNIGGFTARLSKSHWFGIDAPRHLFHFTPETLETVLGQSGFKIIKRSTLSIEQDVFGFAQSILNLLGFPNNIFYDLIRASTGRMRYKFSRIWSIPGFIKYISVITLGGILSGIGLLVAAATALFGRGGTIEYWSNPIDKIYQ